MLSEKNSMIRSLWKEGRPICPLNIWNVLYSVRDKRASWTRPRSQFSGVFAHTLLVKFALWLRQVQAKPPRKSSPVGRRVRSKRICASRQGKGRREYADIAEAFDTALAQIHYSEPCSTHFLVPRQAVKQSWMSFNSAIRYSTDSWG